MTDDQYNRYRTLAMGLMSKFFAEMEKLEGPPLDKIMAGALATSYINYGLIRALPEAGEVLAVAMTDAANDRLLHECNSSLPN